MANSVLFSSLGKKYFMAITGLFLCLFLVGHLLGNLQLMAIVDPDDPSTLNDAMLAFDQYAYFMTTNLFIKVMSYLTYASILLHAVDGIMLTMQNRKARATDYAYNNANANSKPQSRYMALLGTAILLFIVIHMANFWGKMHFGDLGTYEHHNQELKPLYGVVVAFFKHPDYGAIAAILYAVSMAVLGFHLSHGFAASFQSLGLSHAKYTPMIKKAGKVFSILVPVLFAIIPLYIAFGLDIEYEDATAFVEYVAKSSK